MELKYIDTFVEENGKTVRQRMYVPMEAEYMASTTEEERAALEKNFLEEAYAKKIVKCNYVASTYFYCEPCCNGHLKSPEYNYVIRENE